MEAKIVSSGMKQVPCLECGTMARVEEYQIFDAIFDLYDCPCGAFRVYSIDGEWLDANMPWFTGEYYENKQDFFDLRG